MKTSPRNRENIRDLRYLVRNYVQTVNTNADLVAGPLQSARYAWRAAMAAERPAKQ
jgi:hypothetical protein